MDEDTDHSPAKVPDSPKPLAFTIDFGQNQNTNVQSQRQKALAEKFQNRHKRGQSLSKLEESTTTPPKHHFLTGNLPRKSSFQSDGYFSSDEKPDRVKSANARIANASAKRSDLSLALKNITSERMTQSFPNPALPCSSSPELELKDVSSPELDLISPFSPIEQSRSQESSSNSKKTQFLSPECEKLYIGENSDQEIFVDGTDFDFDKSDTASDTGTYTLDAENYSEEQKARMSIDREFKIEQVSVQKKTEEYVKSLSKMRENVLQNAAMMNHKIFKESEVTKGIKAMNFNSNNVLKSPRSPILKKIGAITPTLPHVKLSPIMSPTQNISIIDVEHVEEDALNNSDCDLNNTFTKIMFPSPNAKRDGLKQNYDQGSVISVTSSGAFKKIEKKDKLSSLTKSEVQVQAYIDGKGYNDNFHEPVLQRESKKLTPKLTTTIVNVQSIDVQSSVNSSGVLSANIVVTPKNVNNLPPSIGGYSAKIPSTKIPSPTHMVSRPRSRNSISSLNIEFSDNSMDTDSILKPTQNYINSLQQRLSLDSDQDSDYDVKTQLNNTAHILKQKASHTRHNSLDDRTMNISNKLEHFQNKNLFAIDQTYSNLLNQYSQNRVMHKIQNSPNNSPIRRSSSFSTKNQLLSSKNTNNVKKESNIRNSPNVTRNTSVQRSASTASIKPNYIFNRRGSNSDHQKIDRSQFGDTESSSEEDYGKNNQKRKDLSNVTNTRCNRAFSLRRARADTDNETIQLKCPNTPEMRRKTFQTDLKHERAISVDRKPMKTNDIQSRYLLNISKKMSTSVTPKEIKIVPKVTNANKPLTPARPQSFARTDSGRFSMRASKPPTNSVSKGLRKDTSGKKQGGIRSNSSLSSREVEFQNWKRRKSYDPMKAAAEGKKKEQAKRHVIGGGQNAMTQSYTEANQSQDSSPSHSSSVHRSQSFHGTAALEQLLSSEEEEEDLTLSADEGFSPPTPSPCELSPARANLRHTLWERIRH